MDRRSIFHLVGLATVICTLTATAPLSAQVQALTYNPIDAQYSNALDRIVMVSSNPNQLHIYDPVSHTETTVGLPKPPLAVSVSPDGYYAAVGEDALISYVNLSTGTIQQEYTTNFTVNSLVLNTSWIYVLQNNVESINISTGAVTPFGNYYFNQPTGRLDTSLNALYAASYYGSIANIEVSTGPMTTATSAPYNPNHAFCSPLWISQDGSRIYSACEAVLQASSQTSQDMQYVSSISGNATITAVADSTALQTVAVVEQGYCCSTPDGVVYLFSSTYLQPVGQFTLQTFTANSKTYPAHGKWLFFNAASTNLYALEQADSSSGLANSFAVQTFSMAAPPSCGASFAASNIEVASPGTLGTVGITAASTCTYQTSSDSTWLQIVSGGYASGNGTLTYMARPNLTKSARTGNISMSGQTFTVKQDAAPPSPGAFTALSYNPLTAVYDLALDKIVTVASNPNELHLYDPVSQSDQLIPLPAVPLSLSVSPDGSHAVVGHDGWISYVNLQTPALQNVFFAGQTVSFVVLAANGYAYFYSYYGQVEWIQLSSGAVTIDNNLGFSGEALAYNDGHSIYTTGYNGFQKYDITQVTPSPVTLPITASCNGFWFSQDGSLIFSECATVYTASDVEAQDLLYHGTLANINSVVSAAESSLVHSTAIIPNADYDVPDTQVQLFGDLFLGYAGSIALPQFSTGGQTYAGHGKFVFWNDAATDLFVIEQADSSAKLLSSYAVDVITPYIPGAGCTYSLGSSSASEPQSAGFDSVSVTAGANCAWTATSNASWLTITAGQIGFGPAILNFEFTANTGTVRTAQLTIAGIAFTVTQAGAPCSFIVSPQSIYLDSTSQSSSLTVTTAAGCAWSATASGGFITITSGASGTGSGSVNFAASTNSAGYYRTGSLMAGGQSATVTQRETATIFTDVPPVDYFFDFTNVLYTAGITSGCQSSPLEYCPNDPITREEMAVYLVVGVEGGNNFTYTAQPYFTDVPSSSPYFKFVQKLRDLGITSGCSATLYCPTDPVNRGEMAAFIIRSRYETTPYTYPTTPYFADVPPANIYFPFVQKMAQTGITSGCAPGLYCPDANLNRGQMAVFIVTGLLNELLAPGTPIISSASPKTVSAGQTVTVALTGVNTHFAQGTTQITAAPGIAVSAISVTSSTSLTVQLTVGASVTANPTSIVVTTGTEEAVLPNGLIVQ